MLQTHHISSASPPVNALARAQTAPPTAAPVSWAPWHFLSARAWQQVGEDGFVPDFPSAGRLIVPLALWRARRHELLDSKRPLGLFLHETDDAAAVSTDLTRFALIIVSFTTDQARTFIARSLRRRYGYSGFLAALDASPDRAAALHVEGFDALARRLAASAPLKLEESIELDPLFG